MPEVGVGARWELSSIHIVDVIEQLNDLEHSGLKNQNFGSKILIIEIIEQLDNPEYPFLKRYEIDFMSILKNIISLLLSEVWVSAQ